MPARLVGHVNPSGEYPAVVVPIYEDPVRGLSASYRRRGLPVSHRLPRTFSFVRNIELSKQNFNRARDSIFAIAADELQVFERKKAGEFFAHLFSIGKLDEVNPFRGLAFAHLAREPDRINALLRSCLTELGAPHSPFAKHWYDQQMIEAGEVWEEIGLPSSFRAFWADTSVATIASAPGMKVVLEQLCRTFNVREALSVKSRYSQISSFVLPERNQSDGVSSPTIWAYLTTDPIDDSLREKSSFTELGACEVVLVLSPQFAAKLGNPEPLWGDVFELGLADPDFRWIRPRGDRFVGHALDLALLEMYYDETSSEGVVHLESIFALSQKVARYSPTDESALQYATEEGRWLVDVVAVTRPSAMAFIGDSPIENRPVLARQVRDSEIGELFPTVPLQIQYEDRRLDHPALSQFLNFIDSSEFEELPIVTTVIARGQQTAAASRLYSDLIQQSLLTVRPRERRVAVYLLLDTSSSMGEQNKLDEAKNGLAVFLGKLDPQRGDSIGLIGFSHEITEHVAIGPLNETADIVTASLVRLDANGNTAMRDAIILAWGELRQLTDCIRVIVVLSDGVDNFSRINLPDLIKVVSFTRENACYIYGLAYGQDADFDALNEIARASGGECLRGTYLNVGAIYSAIANRV